MWDVWVVLLCVARVCVGERQLTPARAAAAAVARICRFKNVL